jgi:hypothetical protein
MYLVAVIGIYNLGVAQGLQGLGKWCWIHTIIGIVLCGASVWGCMVIGRLEGKYDKLTMGWTNAQHQAEWDRVARMRCDLQAGRYDAPEVQRAIEHSPDLFWHDTNIEFWRDIHEPLLHDARLFSAATCCSIGICLMERSLRQRGDSGHLLLARIIQERGLVPLADDEKPSFMY